MPSEQRPAHPTRYKVTSQVEGSYRQPNGQFASGVKVTFTTEDGLTGSVEVPESAYNAPNVQQMIRDRIAQLMSVQGLTD